MSSRGRGGLKRIDGVFWLRASWLAGLLIVPSLMAGCAVSKLASPFGSGSEDSSASVVTEDRLLETAKADAGTDLPGGQSAHCPQVVAWPRDRLVTVYQPGHSGDALHVIHRGEITKMARECHLYSGQVVVKYGFAGRILLGPKGKPGSVSFPVNVRVAGVEQTTLATDRVNVSATIPQGNPVGYFSMVREISFPVSVGTRPEDYKVFVAFDHKQSG